MASCLDRTHRKIATFLFLSLNFLFLLTSSGRVRTMDEVTLAFEVESVSTHASTAIPEAVSQNLFYGKYDRFGRPQGPYGLGNVILVLPWYWLGKAVSHIAPGIPADRTTLFTDAFTVASSAAFSALAGTFAFLIFLRSGGTTKTALAAALMMALATPLFSYSSWFYSEPLASALLLGATYFLFGNETAEQLTTKKIIIAGLLLGVLVWARATHVIAIPVFLAAVLLRGPRRDWRAFFTLTAIVGLFGLAYLARNKYLFGNPFDFGYPEFGEGGKRMLGFDTPLFTGLRIFLFSPGKSMLLFAPPLFLAIPGIVRLAKRNRALALVAAGIPLVFLLFFSCYSHVEGSYSYGPRYLVPAIAVASLGLGPTLASAGRRTRRLALALFLAGVAIQGIGMATSFIEDMATGAYYDANWAYRPDYSPIPRMTRQLHHYITSPEPAPLGRGFDRWFVFLAKADVSRGTIAAGIAFELAGFLFFAYKLRKGVLQVANAGPAPITTSDDPRAVATHSL
jgi:MFS family permease